MLFESAGIPLPSEVIMPFSGYLVSVSKFNFYLVVLVGSLGNLAGSLVAYYVGYFAEEKGIRKVITSYGKWVLLNVSDYDMAEKWFRRKGSVIIFVSRVLPVVRTYISFPAGAAKVNLVQFSILTFLGSLVWSFILTEIGVKLGENWAKLSFFFRKFDILIVTVLLVLVALYLYHKVKKENA
jgi:membrane protein DedA with SNARE-associated domain